MATGVITSLNLGSLLQIIFTNSVRNQISSDYRDWEQVKSMQAPADDAREIRFMFRTSYGPGAVQYRNPGTSGRAFPAAQQSSVQENTARSKEINVTIELEYNLWDRARRNPKSRYADALAMEIESKAIASKRRLAADLYGDGTGCLGQATSVSDAAIATGEVVVTLNASLRGFVGFFEYGDLVRWYDDDGSPLRTTTGNTLSVYRVKSKSRSAGTVTLEILDANGAVSTGESASNIAAGDACYRIGQAVIPDLTSNATVGDYAACSEVMAGLDSLSASDGRTIHGIVMSGANAGSRTAGSGVISPANIQAMMDSVKINVGQNAYKYPKMSMAAETQAVLINDLDGDRRFISVEDNKRGIRFFAYQHNNDTLESYCSEYVPKNRVYALPESKDSKEKVMEFHGTDFETVKAQDMSDFHLKPSADGGHVNTISSYLQATGVLICQHPAAVAVLTGFTLA